MYIACGDILFDTLAHARLFDPAAPEQSLGPPNHQQSADSRTGCRPTQNAPYANGIPYLGVHGNPGNSDVIDCETPNAWTRSWHELKGLGMTQPNTFAPDGRTTYITTTNPMPDGCRLFALDTMTGNVSWCRSFSTEIEKGAVEVDSEGHLYFTVGDTLISLDAQGDERWRLPSPMPMADPQVAGVFTLRRKDMWSA